MLNHTLPIRSNGGGGPVAIRVEGLAKRYRLGERSRYPTLRDSLARFGRLPWRASRGEVDHPAGQMRSPANGDATLWALKDVSFEIPPGEVVGVVGPNGAGKSTLLKILSRITEPTRGLVDIYGRVGSLLEVGTGFHPELTGRENIYLNGAILGMRKAEVDRKFEEIVEFAELARFMDTPVKRYSSGMYMRLAFSVAAHLETEILLVDEVLAVGDAAFQRKCLGKMGDLAGQGRTVVFVSHNMAAIARLCGRALLLRDGNVVLSGDPDTVLRSYFTGPTAGTGSYHVDAARLGTGAPVAITAIDLLELEGAPITDLHTGQSLVLRVGYAVEPGVELPSAAVVVRIKTQLGIELIRLSTTPISGFPLLDVSGTGQVDLVLPVLPFAAGRYMIDVAIARPGQTFYTELQDIASFDVRPFDVYRSGTAIGQSRGVSVVTHRWVHRPSEGQADDSGWIGRRLLDLPEASAPRELAPLSGS